MGHLPLERCLAFRASLGWRSWCQPAQAFAWAEFLFSSSESRSRSSSLIYSSRYFTKLNGSFHCHFKSSSSDDVLRVLALTHMRLSRVASQRGPNMDMRI